MNILGLPQESEEIEINIDEFPQETNNINVNININYDMNTDYSYSQLNQLISFLEKIKKL